MPEIDVSEALTGTVDESDSSTRTYSQSASLEEIPEECADILLDLMEQANDNDIHLHFSADRAESNGREISDEYKEAYDLPDGVDTWSYEDLLIFGDIDMEEISFYGWPPRNEDGELKDDHSSSEFIGDYCTEIKRRFNGQFAEEIAERFDSDGFSDEPETLVNMRVATKQTTLPDGTTVERDEYERRKHVNFYLRDAEETQADETMLKARNKYGDLSDEKLAELLGNAEESEESEETEE